MQPSAAIKEASRSRGNRLLDSCSANAHQLFSQMHMQKGSLQHVTQVSAAQQATSHAVLLHVTSHMLGLHAIHAPQDKPDSSNKEACID